MRIDQLLVQRGLAASRSQAARLVGEGVSWRALASAPWRKATKAGDDVPDAAELQLADDSESRYVSRGGLKLAGALLASGVNPAGRQCLDVGKAPGASPIACCNMARCTWWEWMWATANCTPASAPTAA
jgi:23S rRNA (cytidine1920-2'-O)/16S rRNA (cytidine1409-2'-O)-methyltransferase